MNRLAQALIAIERRSKAAEVETTEHSLETPLASVPVVLDAEVVEALPLGEVVQAPRKRRPKPEREEQSPVAVPATVDVQPATIPSNRRKGYRSLVRLRNVCDRWGMLSPFFGVPSQELLTSVDIFRFLEMLTACRKALSELKSWPIAAGGLVRAIIVSPTPLALFRDLQHSQRESLASDWAVSQSQWQAEVRSLRLALRNSRPPRTARQRLRAIRKWGTMHPEWKLGLAITVAFAIALIRLRR
jgi:hypothetical protein